MLTTLPPIPPAYVQRVEDDCVHALRGLGLPAHFTEVKKGDGSLMILEGFPNNIGIKVSCSFSGSMTFDAIQPASARGIISGERDMQIDFVEERISNEGPQAVYFDGR